MQMPLLVKSSITVNGKKFTTMIHEGASAEELIAKVAKENGGGVAKVYYPEFKTHEIVAVKIGDQLIVKGDPKRVQDGDFSEFDNADAVKAAAVSASSSSKGGIHFFVGSDGIPMAAAENEGLVFPNAQELRVNTNINNLSLAVVDYNVDPNNIRDINKLYKKGAKISQAAREEIEQSHGGVRSEKLMLPDTSVLILSRESGDIRTASEFASNFKAEGFAFKPPSPQQFLVPQQVQRGLQLPSDLGVMHIPLDGSSFKVPYLCVKVFDGKVTDAIKVTTYPPEETPRRRRKKPEPAPEPQRITPPKIIGEMKVREIRPDSAVEIKEPKTEPIISVFDSPKILQQIPDAKKPEPAVSFEPMAAPKPKSAVTRKVKAEKLPEPIMAASKPAKQKSRAAKKAAKPRAKVVRQKQTSARTKAAKKARPKASAKKRKTARAKPKKEDKPAKTKKPKSIKPKPAKAQKPKPAKTKKAKAPKPKPTKTKKKPGISSSKKAKTRKKKASPHLVKISTDWSAKTPKKMSKKKRKKIQSYYLNTMLGLFKSKRSGARSSKRKKAASRT